MAKVIVNTKPINTLYAWLMKDEDGNEGIYTINSYKGEQFPLIASDEKLLKDKAILDLIKKETNVTVVWAEFERKHISLS